MAKNQKFITSRTFNTAVPAGVLSGAPVLVGANLTGVALTDRDANGNATIDTEGVYTIAAVKAIDGGGNSPIAVGDKLYFVTGDTPPVSKKATGVPYGTAWSTLATGTTGGVDVAIDKK